MALVVRATFCLVAEGPTPIRDLFPIHFFTNNFRAQYSHLARDFLRDFARQEGGSSTPCTRYLLRRDPAVQGVTPVTREGSRRDEQRDM